MIYADRKKLLQQSYFDYTGKQISQHFHQISDEIKKSKKISMEDAEKLIVQAVSFNANFVVRPKWSMIKLIYNDQHSISVEDLEIMLKYVYYYDYIKNVLGAYLSKRKVIQLSLTEFELILNKIDRELFKSNSEQLIDNALNSIGDFFSIGGLDKSTVSVAAVEILLKEKNLIEYLMRLRKNIPEGGKKKLSIEDMRRILFTPAGKDEGTAQTFVDTESEEIFANTESSKDEMSSVDFTEDEVEEKTTIGELADIHAKEVEQSETGELLSPEEEQKLLSLYEADLENFEADITDAISHKDDFESFSKLQQEEELEKSKEPKLDSNNQINVNPDEKELTREDDLKNIKTTEKDIVDEMIRDFFGDEDDEEMESEELNKVINEPELTEKIEPEEPAIDLYNSVKEDLPQKIDSSLEDELLEVFDELEKLGDDTGTDNEDQNGREISEFDLIDKDLETIDRIAFTEEKQKSITEKKPDQVVRTTATEIKKKTEKEITKEQKPEIRTPIVNRTKLPETERVFTKTVSQKSIPANDEDFGRPLRKKDLLSYLNRKEIKKIISYVFSGDREDFVTTAERIMDCKGYKEASEILRSVFSSYKISHYSKDAITLTNAVSNYFRQT
jgi:hypothetical protein